MTRASTAIAALLITVLGTALPAGSPAQTPLSVGAPTSAKAGARALARKGAKPAPARARSAPAAPAPAAAAKADSAAGRPEAPSTGAGARTLEDIHIEGEIPVPQVLFITARDQRRFLEFQHQRYLRTSRKLGEETVRPSWVLMTGTDATTNKETPR